MTLFQVEELCQYWGDHPPVHLLLAGFMGVKPMGRQLTAAAPRPELTLPSVRVLAAIPGLQPAAADDLPPAIFDAAELFAMRP